MKRFAKERIGMVEKKADAITYVIEDELCRNDILGVKSPIHFCGLCFLQLSQIEVEIL